MAISWNEIKTRAAVFINEWKDKAPTAREEADAQTFQTEFFHIFGVSRSQVAIFEQRVKLNVGSDGYMAHRVVEWVNSPTLTKILLYEKKK